MFTSGSPRILGKRFVEFIFNYPHVCGHLWTCAYECRCHRDQRHWVGPPELELKVVVSLLTWVLGTENQTLVLWVWFATELATIFPAQCSRSLSLSVTFSKSNKKMKTNKEKTKKRRLLKWQKTKQNVHMHTQMHKPRSLSCVGQLPLGMGSALECVQYSQWHSLRGH